MLSVFAYTVLFSDLSTLPGDVLPGGGWAGAGLLGLVLWWLLFKHLPNKDQQIKELIGDHNGMVSKKDEQITGLISTQERKIENLSDTFQKALSTVVEHCKEESEKLYEKFCDLTALISSNLKSKE